MLVLSRHRSESIVIDPRNCPINELGLIEIFVVDIRGDKVRLGIEAPASIPVNRREVHDAIHDTTEAGVQRVNPRVAKTA
jgi:carbon storage regulator